MTIKDKLASLRRRRRPVTREYASEIADWVNEGGAFDPAGPPKVIDDVPGGPSSADDTERTTKP